MLYILFSLLSFSLLSLSFSSLPLSSYLLPLLRSLSLSPFVYTTSHFSFLSSFILFLSSFFSSLVLLLLLLLGLLGLLELLSLSPVCVCSSIISRQHGQLRKSSRCVATGSGARGGGLQAGEQMIRLRRIRDYIWHGWVCGQSGRLCAFASGSRSGSTAAGDGEHLQDVSVELEECCEGDHETATATKANPERNAQQIQHKVMRTQVTPCEPNKSSKKTKRKKYIYICEALGTNNPRVERKKKK
jgi:hypothetical protein